jgi:hypothetical protein
MLVGVGGTGGQVCVEQSGRGAADGPAQAARRPEGVRTCLLWKSRARST